MVFKDRKDAGLKLAEKLKRYKSRSNVVVVGITRGGVEVAKEVAELLDLPLTAVVVKKLGHPLNPEYGIGAVDADGAVYLSRSAKYEASEDYLNKEVSRLKEEIKNKLEKYGLNDIEHVIKDRVCIVVDDGIATGLTTMAAAEYLRRHHARKLVLAVPVAPPDSLKKLEKKFDEIVCLLTPQEFMAVSQFYVRFPQLDDEDVSRILQKIT